MADQQQNEIKKSVKIQDFPQINTYSTGISRERSFIRTSSQQMQVN